MEEVIPHIWQAVLTNNGIRNNRGYPMETATQQIIDYLNGKTMDDLTDEEIVEFLLVHQALEKVLFPYKYEQ